MSQNKPWRIIRITAQSLANSDLGRRARWSFDLRAGVDLGQWIEPRLGSGAECEDPVQERRLVPKNCRNVLLRFSILYGGHWIRDGVDNLTIDNLKIDTNRDGMDIDCCRNVRVSNGVNSPWMMRSA
jgi:polygalacturonase